MSYDFMEVSMGCSDCERMARFFEELFDAKTIFRGRMMGEPFVRMVACGITFIFRQQSDWQDGRPDPAFRNHLGLRVADLPEAIGRLKARGAKFVLEPDMVGTLQKGRTEDGVQMLETTFVAEPLSLETLADSGYRHDVAILQGPDGLYIELNEVHMPEGVDWF